MPSNIQSIAVVGSGTGLPMAGALLASHLKNHGVSITCIKLPCSEQQATSEATGIEFEPLCEMLGLNKMTVIKACSGTFRLGSHITAQQKKSSTTGFISMANLGLGDIPTEFEQTIFEHLRLHANDKLEHFSLSAQAAYASKFAIPDNRHPELVDALTYGAHLDSQAYQALLEQHCTKLGVTFIDVHSIQEVCLDQKGCIHQITLDDNTKILSDFWVDCSGSKAVLSQHLDSGPIQDLAKWIPYNAQIHFSKNNTVTTPYTTIAQTEFGILKEIPLRNNCAYTFNYPPPMHNKAYSWLKKVTGENLSGVPHVALTPKTSTTPWVNNCLAVGSAATQLDNLIFSELSLIQAAIIHFLDVYPRKTPSQPNIQNYNSAWLQHTLEARDFISAHHFAHSYINEKILTTEANPLNHIPENIIDILNLFERLGRPPTPESDAVTKPQWISLLYGLGLRPQVKPITQPKMNLDDFTRLMNSQKGIIKKIVQSMPHHNVFIKALP